MDETIRKIRDREIWKNSKVNNTNKTIKIYIPPLGGVYILIFSFFATFFL